MVKRGRKKNIDKYYEPISIVMPVLNNLEFTERCVESLKKNTIEKCELIVIDNNSDDGTKEYFSSLELPENIELNYVFNEENVGVCPSWNQGVKLAKYNYICIINNDIEFLTPNWAFNMEKILRKNENIFWTSPRVVYTKDMNKVCYKICHYEQLVYSKSAPNSYIVGCCFMCPRKAFEELGPFDEQFSIAYYEDLDYINRILEAGRFATMSHDVMIYHAVGTTSRITKSDGKNEQRYNAKWGNKSHFDILKKQPWGRN